MEMDWGEDEEAAPAHRDSPNIFDERAREKTKSVEAAEKPKNKFADIMAKPPTPQVNHLGVWFVMISAN